MAPVAPGRKTFIAAHSRSYRGLFPYGAEGNLRESLRDHPECVVESGTVVLQRDRGGHLDQLPIAEVLPQRPEEVDACGPCRHGLSSLMPSIVTRPRPREACR